MKKPVTADPVLPVLREDPKLFSDRTIDLVLLLVVIGMVAFGLLMVYSASFIFAQERSGDGLAFIKKQIIFALAGFAAMAGLTRIDYSKWSKWAYPLLGFSVFLLGLVAIPGIGARMGGAQRWLRIGWLSFQPGELAKFTVIIFVANQLYRKQEKIRTFKAGILSSLLIPLPIMALLLKQPDFGTTIMITIVIFALMFLAGVRKRDLVGTIGFLTAVGLFLALSTPYRRTRVMTFLDPWTDPGGKGFQILQSMVGLHYGRFFGVGLGNSREKLFYLPEAHNDFIFAVIGEELGLVGVIAVVLAYIYFIYRGLKIAWDAKKKYDDTFGLLLASGITLALGFQGFVNMAVVLGLLPTKGLTLPFISYGGSALLIDLAAVGVLLSVGRGPGKSGALK